MACRALFSPDVQPVDAQPACSDTSSFFNAEPEPAQSSYASATPTKILNVVIEMENRYDISVGFGQWQWFDMKSQIWNPFDFEECELFNNHGKNNTFQIVYTPYPTMRCLMDTLAYRLTIFSNPRCPEQPTIRRIVRKVVQVDMTTGMPVNTVRPSKARHCLIQSRPSSPQVISPTLPTDPSESPILSWMREKNQPPKKKPISPLMLPEMVHKTSESFQSQPRLYEQKHNLATSAISPCAPQTSLRATTNFETTFPAAMTVSDTNMSSLQESPASLESPASFASAPPPPPAFKSKVHTKTRRQTRSQTKPQTRSQTNPKPNARRF
jgi:hypothetical protein